VPRRLNWSSAGSLGRWISLRSREIWWQSRPYLTRFSSGVSKRIRSCHHLVFTPWVAPAIIVPAHCLTCVTKTHQWTISGGRAVTGPYHQDSVMNCAPAYLVPLADSLPVSYLIAVLVPAVGIEPTSRYQRNFLRRKSYTTRLPKYSSNSISTLVAEW